MLDELKFAPSKEMIIYNRGVYAWNNKLNFVVDTDQFTSLCILGDEEEDVNRKIAYYLDALEYYKGDFLPKSSLEAWVVPINAYYHSEFLRVVQSCVELLKEQGRSYDVITVCQQAVAIDPYDESLHYEHVVDLFYSEFGINLSDELTDLYKEIIKESNGIEVDLSLIRDRLQEEDGRPGAFYCEYSLFKEIYHLETRSASRNGQSIYLCLMSVTDGNNGVLDNKRQQNAAMSQLHSAIQYSLRRGDVFTRYSVSQYLIMLPTVSFENGEMVLKRIQKNFKKENPHSKAIITYKLQPLTPQM